jgi:hypothetical protein
VQRREFACDPLEGLTADRLPNCEQCADVAVLERAAQLLIDGAVDRGYHLIDLDDGIKTRDGSPGTLNSRTRRYHHERSYLGHQGYAQALGERHLAGLENIAEHGCMTEVLLDRRCDPMRAASVRCRPLAALVD